MLLEDFREAVKRWAVNPQHGKQAYVVKAIAAHGFKFFAERSLENAALCVIPMVMPDPRAATVQRKRAIAGWVIPEHVLLKRRRTEVCVADWDEHDHGICS